MTWRCVWTAPKHFAPDHIDFRYQQAADVLADIKRLQGCTDVDVIELPEGDA